VGHVTSMGKMRNAYKSLVKRTKGNRPLGGTRHRCKDNVKMDPK